MADLPVLWPRVACVVVCMVALGSSCPVAAWLDWWAVVARVVWLCTMTDSITTAVTLLVTLGTRDCAGPLGPVEQLPVAHHILHHHQHGMH